MRLQPFCEIASASGVVTDVGFLLDPHSIPEALVNDEFDAVISGCEVGFSEFGLHSNFLADQLGIGNRFIEAVATTNRHREERVTLLGFRKNDAAGPERNLRGLVLLPYGGAEPGRGCVSYRRFEGSLPSRDFYYNVAFEAFRIACEEMGARRILVMNPAAPWSFHKNIATCVCEALGHWCDLREEFAPESVVFSLSPDASGMRSMDFSEVRTLNNEGHLTAHRPISVTSRSFNDEDGNRVELTDLDWWS